MSHIQRVLLIVSLIASNNKVEANQTAVIAVGRFKQKETNHRIEFKIFAGELQGLQ